MIARRAPLLQLQARITQTSVWRRDLVHVGAAASVTAPKASKDFNMLTPLYPEPE